MNVSPSPYPSPNDKSVALTASTNNPHQPSRNQTQTHSHRLFKVHTPAYSFRSWLSSPPPPEPMETLWGIAGTLDNMDLITVDPMDQGAAELNGGLYGWWDQNHTYERITRNYKVFSLNKIPVASPIFPRTEDNKRAETQALACAQPPADINPKSSTSLNKSNLPSPQVPAIQASEKVVGSGTQPSRSRQVATIKPTRKRNLSSSSSSTLPRIAVNTDTVALPFDSTGNVACDTSVTTIAELRRKIATFKKTALVIKGFAPENMAKSRVPFEFTGPASAYGNSLNAFTTKLKFPAGPSNSTKTSQKAPILAKNNVARPVTKRAPPRGRFAVQVPVVKSTENDAVSSFVTGYRVGNKIHIPVGPLQFDFQKPEDQHGPLRFPKPNGSTSTTVMGPPPTPLPTRHKRKNPLDSKPMSGKDGSGSGA